MLRHICVVVLSLLCSLLSGCTMLSKENEEQPNPQYDLAIVRDRLPGVVHFLVSTAEARPFLFCVIPQDILEELVAKGKTEKKLQASKKTCIPFRDGKAGWSVFTEPENWLVRQRIGFMVIPVSGPPGTSSPQIFELYFDERGRAQAREVDLGQPI